MTMIVVIGVMKKDALQNRLVVQQLNLNVVMVHVYQDNGDVIENRYLCDLVLMVITKSSILYHSIPYIGL